MSARAKPSPCFALHLCPGLAATRRGPGSCRFAALKALAWGFHGPIAVDRDWSELERVYHGLKGRRATSASFLVDGTGVIRFVHPGPVLFPSDDPQHARENADYQALEKAIQALLPR